MKQTQTLSTPGGAATTRWLPLDNDIAVFNVGLFVDVTGTVSATIEGTLDDVQDPTVTPVAFSLPIAALVGLTADQVATLTMPVKAIRINQASGAGTILLKALQQGVI